MIRESKPRSSQWQDQAKCRNKNTNFFFPAENELKKQRAAKAFCQGCPVRQECYNLGVETNSDGIFGGTTKTDREFIRLLMPNLLSSDDPGHTPPTLPENTSLTALDSDSNSRLARRLVPSRLLVAAGLRIG